MSGTASASGTGVEIGRPRTRMRWVLLIALLSVIAVVCAAAMALLRTQRGQQVVLDALLEQSRTRLNAEVSVSGIRSDDLLAEATLSGITIAEPGRPLAFSADSIRARYSIWTLLRGESALAGLELWNPVLIVERRAGEDESNWSRILADPRDLAVALNPQEGSAGPRSSLVVRDISLFDGEIAVRLPTAAPGGGVGVVEAPGGDGFLREQRFSRIRGRLREVDIGAGEDVIDVFSLSLLGSVTEEPFELADFRGQVRLNEDELSFDAERLWLPETEMSGTGVVAWGRGVRIDASLSAPVAAFEDIRWLVPGLPPARGGLDLGLRIRSDTISLVLSSLNLQTGDGGLDGRLTLAFSTGSTLLDGELGLRELRVSAFDPWLGPLPWRGALSGRVRMEGRPEDLEIGGELETIGTDPAQPPSHFEFGGRVHLGPDPGVTAFSLASAQFQYGLLGEMDERLAIGGAGSLRVDAGGRLTSGIDFSVSAAHRAPGLPESAVSARGTVSRRDDETFLDVSGDLGPLSFTALGAYFPPLPLIGEVSGAVSARGPLADLDVEVDLQTPAGPLAMKARFNARDIGRSYLAETEVRDFHLSRILPQLPEPTIVTGGVFVDGRGLEPDSVEADVRARVASATVGPVTVDSARSTFRLEAGAATLDTLHIATSLGILNASGTLGLADGLPPGEIRVALAAESLDGLRPFFMSGPMIAADTLSRLEAEMLRLEGIDPGTLPLQRDIAVDGRIAAQATLRGAVDQFAAEGIVRIEDFRYQDNAVARAELDVRVDGLPGTQGRLTASILADSFAVEGRDFISAAIDLGLSRSDGRLLADLQRSSEESYQVRATFQADSTGGVVNLDELTARFVGGRWNLGGPTRLFWDAESFAVDNFSFTRPGPERGMRIEADGFIPRGRGPADFDLLVRDLPLERLTHVARLTTLEERNLRGVVSLGLQVSQTGNDPGMVASFEATDPGFGSVELGRVAGELRYGNRRISGKVEAWNEDVQVLSARGTLAAVLELERVPTRFPEEPMDIAVLAGELPIAVVSGAIPDLDEVEGLVDGELHLTGSPANVRTDGELSLRGGALALPALGVRYTNVEAVLGFTEDAQATLSASLRSDGPAQVNGSLHLRPLRDPAFELTIGGTGFRAANRYDIEGVVSGQLSLTGNYRSPVVQGALDVEQGTLYLDEFARYQTIVDLADATFFAAVDTTLAGVLPIIEAGQNPFFDNLVADVELRVQSDTWLRSRQMDMEIDGDLQLEYDRRARRFVAAGELAAIRGSYNSFGRRFVVQEGTLEFIGIPGVNPNLDIQAVARLRAGDNPLNVIANVGGTLVAPSVSLTSDAPAPIEEPELISYLVFGRPPALLGSSESSVLSGASEPFFTLGMGYLAEQLQQAVAQEIGFVDYFAISSQRATQRLGPDPSLLGTLASTQIGFGRYLWDDVFVSVDLVPVGSANRTRTRLPNARLEWRFADHWGFESFAEDPLLRRGVLGVQPNGPTFAHSLGLFVYREWGR